MSSVYSPRREQRERTESLPALSLVRLPGEFGPTLRCYGELSVATAELLRRELDLLESLDHPVLTVNLAGCDVVDLEGILTMFDCFKSRREQGRRLVIVAGTRAVARLLHVVGMDRMMPVFPTEEAAALTLRGGWPPLPGPDTWTAAWAETVVRWQVIQEALQAAPREEILRLLTSMTALCERSEELLQEFGAPSAPGSASESAARGSRCQFCPLFHALGGQPEDVGCHSLVDPIVDAVRASDLNTAGAQVMAVTRWLREMPFPDESAAPDIESPCYAGLLSALSRPSE